MSVDIAIRCDTEDCLALIIIPENAPLPRPYAADNGWRPFPRADRCPACVIGRGPVLEVGECPRCHGSQFTDSRRHTEQCHHCGHGVPYDPDDDELTIVISGSDEDEHQDHATD